MNRRLALWILVLAFVPLGARAQEEEPRPPVSPERLRADLEQGARLFRRTPEGAAAKSYAESIGYVDVEFRGKTITVRDPWLADHVNALDGAATPADRAKVSKEISEHLAARAAAVDVDLAAAAGATPAATATQDPDKVLQGILEQRQFHAETEDPKLARAAAAVRDKIRDGWNKLNEFVRNLFSDDAREESWGQKLRRLGAIAISIVAVLVGLWLLARAMLRATADDASADADASMPDEPPRPAIMTAEADLLAARGDLRGAVRALYLALLGDLHAQGAIVYDRHRTNREYLRTMRLDPPRADAFAAAVEVFDRKWYGREACTPAELAAFRELGRLAGRPLAVAA